MNNSLFSDMGNYSVVAYASGDVNGDKIADEVFLIGVKATDSSLIKDISLVIQNGATGMISRIPLKENQGYNPSLFLGDFTGNKIKNILISIATGGSGGTYYYYIYSYVQNRARLIFNYNGYNEQFHYEVIYLDHYRVEVRSNKNHMRYLIDISLRGSEYLNEIYYKDGRLKEPVTGWVDPIGGLYPIYYNSDQVYELLALQQIAGRYHADSLGFVQNILQWNRNMFVLERQEVAVFGTNFYEYDKTGWLNK